MRSVVRILLIAAVGVYSAVRGLFSPYRGNDRDPVNSERDHRRKQVGLKGWVFRIAAFGFLLAVLGFIFSASGIIPIKASSGHWPITAWILDFSKRRSVSTHTLTLKPPPLDEPSLTLKGAAHYELECANCHGSPNLQTPRIAQGMTPPPPYLPPRISRWESEELFYIVKHGIKFTGMPAWPAQQRDDEVWAMVAFLRTLPTLDGERYQRLVSGETGANAPPLKIAPESLPPAIAANCGRCHGPDGLGGGVGAFPKLAGQRKDYLLDSLQAFARGERHSGIMEPILVGKSPEELQGLANYFSGLLPLSAPSSVTDENREAIVRGEAIAQQGIPGQDVPPCAGCHDHLSLPRNPHYPKLSGQYSNYLWLQLELFKKDQRGGGPFARVMRPVAIRLTTEQMRDVSLYYSIVTITQAEGTATR
jgi:cytochrome c553